MHPKLEALRHKLRQAGSSAWGYNYECICGVCEDTGEVGKRHFILKVMGEKLPVTLETACGEALVYEPCPNPACAKGVASKLTWRTGDGLACSANCYRGWLLYERDFGGSEPAQEQEQLQTASPVRLSVVAGDGPDPDKSQSQARDEEISRLFCQVCKEGRELATRMQEQLAEVKRELVARRFERSGLAEDMRAKTFDNFQTKPAPVVIQPGLDSAEGEQESMVVGQLISPVEAAELLRAKTLVYRAAKLGQSLSLFGTPGSGKSHLAAAYLNYTMSEQGRCGIFISFIGLLQNLRATLKASKTGSDGIGGSEEHLDWTELLERYTSVDVLVLDDLGTEKTSDTTQEVLFHLLNRRINAKLATVVTSNYTLAELEARHGYTRAIISRLGSFARVNWQAGDWRDKEAYLAEQTASAALGFEDCVALEKAVRKEPRARAGY